MTNQMQGLWEAELSSATFMLATLPLLVLGFDWTVKTPAMSKFLKRCNNAVLWSMCLRPRSVGINCFWLARLVRIFHVLLAQKTFLVGLVDQLFQPAQSSVIILKMVGSVC